MLVSRGCPISEISINPKNNNNLSDQDLTLFTYSREAILAILQSHHICMGDEVMVPDYLCSTVIDCILPFTNKIIFYNIDNYLKHEDSEITGLISPKTRMIFFVDYFGVETRVGPDLQDLLAVKRILIVKDASHSFLSVVNKDFSSDCKYDYLISSVYKNIPLQAGAIGIGNFEHCDDFVSLSVILRRSLVLLVKNIICIFGFGWLLSSRMCDVSIADEKKILCSKGINISGSYKKLLSRIDLDEIVKNRLEITDKFNKFFSEKSGLRPVFFTEDINENILQDYPLYVDNQEDRDRLLKILVKNSIDAYTWPTFHIMNHSEHLWSKILVLPLHQKVLEVLKNL